MSHKLLLGAGIAVGIGLFGLMFWSDFYRTPRIEKETCRNLRAINLQTKYVENVGCYVRKQGHKGWITSDKYYEQTGGKSVWR